MAAVVVLAGCTQHKAFPDHAKTNVVAAFFPLAEAARRVGGARVRVLDLTPPNVEPHDLEITSDQVDQVEQADVVILLGAAFQPSLAKAARRAKGAVVRIDPPTDDPHIWLDPVQMKGIAERVATALHGDAGAFTRDLDALDADYRTGLAHCARTTIVTAHKAFAYLAARYGLTQQAIAGFDPEAEPTASKLAELTDLIKRTGTTTVFTEQLVSPKVAQTLARETGATTAVLNPLESGRPGTYISAMRTNLDRLRTALGCS